MSAMDSKDAVLVKIAMQMGYERSKYTANFMKKMETYIDTFFDNNIPVRDRLKTIEKYGLADNKIDTEYKVKEYFFLIGIEMQMQDKFIRDGLYYFLEASVSRCDFYIIEIGRIISPENLDVGHADRADETISSPTVSNRSQVK